MEPWHSPAGGEGGGSEGATPARGPQPAPPKLLTAPDTPVPQRPPLHLHQPHASPGPGHPPTPQATGPHARGPRQLGHALCRAELSGPTLCCPCAPLSSATHPLHEHLESTSLPGTPGRPGLASPAFPQLSPAVLSPKAPQVPSQGDFAKRRGGISEMLKTLNHAKVSLRTRQN